MSEESAKEKKLKSAEELRRANRERQRRFQARLKRKREGMPEEKRVIEVEM